MPPSLLLRVNMSDTDLGNRLKANYENRTRYQLPRRTYTIIRLDGKGFSGYTKRLTKPFDANLISDMDRVAQALCKEVQGCRLAYTQSDEITLVLTDFESANAEAWFDGNLQKIVSISAALATAYFNDLRHGTPDHPRLAIFDSRAFTIAERSEVIEQLVWRQLDAMRNSISMIARTQFSHQERQWKATAG